MKTFLIAFFLSPILLLSQKKEFAFKTFTLHPVACSGFQTGSGSFIFVPQDAFVTESGESCTQKITIKYREFHSQTDMFYSGLNMIFNDNGKYRILESAGMFEIQAWCGDKKLLLKEGKMIQVRMKTRRNIDSLRSFIYNYENNTWSKYSARVFDFSYFKNKNSKDSLALWGSPAITSPQPSQDFESETGGNWVPEKLYNELPEGFFKGMNIGKLGTFNYDGVIKDSLAVPMIPQFTIRTSADTIQTKLFVAYEGKNTLVYYFPWDFKEHFVLLNVRGIKMFTEFSDGSIAVLKNGELDKVNLETYRNKSIQISLDKQPAKPKSEKELSAITGLKTE
jgi:hypothetical protein